MGKWCKRDEELVQVGVSRDVGRRGILNGWIVQTYNNNTFHKQVARCHWIEPLVTLLSRPTRVVHNPANPTKRKVFLLTDN